MLGMPIDELIFDRVEVVGVERDAELPDGASFLVRVRNVGDGIKRSAVVPAEVSRSAIACLEEPVESWLATWVERTGNAQNDGNKISSLVAKGPLRYDSRYVLS
jgi:hypothetical protein